MNTLLFQKQKYSKLEGKTHILNWNLPLKFQNFRIAVLYTFIYLWLVYCTFNTQIFKFWLLKFSNYMMFQHTLSLYSTETCVKPESAAELIFVAEVFFVEVSLMLGNPFSVIFSCCLKHFSFYFIKNIMKIPSTLLIHFTLYTVFQRWSTLLLEDC